MIRPTTNTLRLAAIGLLGLFPLTGIQAQQSATNNLDANLDAEALSQTATALTVIFDTSGSMNDSNKLNQAKRAFAAWAAELPEDYRLGLIHFQRGKGKIAVPLGEGNRAKIVQSVKAFGASGKTPICECLKLSLKSVTERRHSHSPYERHVVVVFTDGAETIDPRLNKGVVEEIKRLRRAQIEVVGIGFHGEGDYMKSATTKYYSAKDETQLAKALSKVDAEIGDNADIDISASELKMMSNLQFTIPPAPSS